MKLRNPNLNVASTIKKPNTNRSVTSVSAISFQEAEKEPEKPKSALKSIMKESTLKPDESTA